VWLRSVSKFVQPVNLHSDYDLIEELIFKQEGDGDYFLVHWFLDLGSKQTFYADVVVRGVFDFVHGSYRGADVPRAHCVFIVPIGVFVGVGVYALPPSPNLLPF